MIKIIESKDYDEKSVLQLVDDIKRFAESQYGEDTVIYYLGKAERLRLKFSKDYETCDFEWVEHSSKPTFDYVRDPNILSMSFDGPLYDTINYTESGEKRLQDIFGKYGLYFELGNEWNLSAYPREDGDWLKFDKIASKKHYNESTINESVASSFSKYNITRNPSEDFSDDGNRFKAYKYGDIPITYLASNGKVYLSISTSDLLKITSDEAMKLPSYKLINKYNGVDESSVDMDDFVSICKKFSDEYNDFINNVEKPDKDEFIKYCTDYKEYYEDQVNKASDLIKDNFDKVMSSNYLDKVKYYYTSLKSNMDRYASLLNKADELEDSVLRYYLSDNSLKYKDVQLANETSYYLDQLSELVRG